MVSLVTKPTRPCWVRSQQRQKAQVTIKRSQITIGRKIAGGGVRIFHLWVVFCIQLTSNCTLLHLPFAATAANIGKHWLNLFWKSRLRRTCRQCWGGRPRWGTGRRLRWGTGRCPKWGTGRWPRRRSSPCEGCMAVPASYPEKTGFTSCLGEVKLSMDCLIDDRKRTIVCTLGVMVLACVMV